MRGEYYLVREVDCVDGLRELLEHGDELGVEHGGGDLGDLGHDEVAAGHLELVSRPPLRAVGGQVIHLLGQSEEKMKRMKQFNIKSFWRLEHSEIILRAF